MLTGFFIQYTMRNLLTATLEKTIAKQASNMSIIAEERFNKELSDLKIVAKYLEEHSNETVEREFIKNLKINSDGVKVGIKNLNGEIILGDDIENSNFYRYPAVKRGNDVVDYSTTQGLLFAVPIMNGKNVHAVLYRLYEDKLLSEMFGLGEYTADSKFMIQERNGQIIIPYQNFNRKDVIFFNDKKTIDGYKKIREMLENQRSAAIYIENQYGKYFLFSTDLPQTNCAMVGFVSWNAVAGDIFKIYTLLILIGAFIWLAFAAVSAYLFIIKTKGDTLREAKQIADSENEAKSAFLAQMSHEIRTPINAVLGMNEMILRECKDSELITYAESVKSAGNTLLSLINDILDFSKIEAGKIEIIPVDYDLSSLINDLVNMIQIKADDKGLALALDFDKNIPKMLYGDEVRVKQIITNILTNSVKYTEKGSVTFSMGFKRVEDDPDSVILLVSIKDTGIGIKQEDMKKLFAEFERIDEERNRNIEGTGLGMTITKNLLYLMGSNLNVESVYGSGSTFSFELKQKVIKWEPLGDYEASFKASLEERDKYKEKFTAPTAKVLVIDDNPMNLMVFKNLLKQTKIKIDTANSGDEGIFLTQDNKYDIIFLDHMMPEMDGIETLQELRAQKKNINCDTITICLTANAISGAREKYIKAGFDNYLTKPINPDKLEETLLEYLPKEKIEAASEDSFTEQPKSKTQDVSSIQVNYKYLNIATGLKYSNGAEDMLRLSIEMFCNLKNENKEKIQKSLESENWNNYTTFVHALKSTALSIGGEQTSNLAKKLEAEGDILRDNDSSESDKQKAEEYIKSHHAEAMESYDKLVEEGRRYLNEGKNDEIQNSLDVQAETSANDDDNDEDDDSDLELMLGFQNAFEDEDWSKYAELLKEINNDIDEEVAKIIKQLEIECKKIISDTISDDERESAINYIKENHSKVLEML